MSREIMDENETRRSAQEEMRVYVLGFLFWGFVVCFCKENARPSKVKIGALVAYDSTIGRVARRAIELAVEDINSITEFLKGTRLELLMMNTNCSAFIGTATALEMLKKEVVAIIGSQSSVISRMVSSMASQFLVPLLSFAATDPTLSSNQYRYFLLVTHTDFIQMRAIADLIVYFGWKAVTVVYVDDDYGRNGIMVLDDALMSLGLRIVFRASLPPKVSKTEIEKTLVQLSLMESRVFVVHVNSDIGLALFSQAKFLGMLNSGYVWLATDWLSSALDAGTYDSEMINSLQGVISLRRHIKTSERLHDFALRWNSLINARIVDAHLNVFGLYAYDTVWTVAYAINGILSMDGNLAFTDYPHLLNIIKPKSELAQVKMLNGGEKLLESLLHTNFTGLIGPVQLNKDTAIQIASLEIINIVGTGFRQVSYWSQNCGLSVFPPESKHCHQDKIIYDIIWHWESKLVPRGWVFPSSGKRLLVGVPRKTVFQEFISTFKNPRTLQGYCIDVFVAAINLLPYPVSYTFVPFGTGDSTPSYDTLVEQVALKKYDAVVGDITIVTSRSKIVDFTQPYIDSGLVMITATTKRGSSNAWAFLQPFTPAMWLTTGTFSLIIGAVVWILEHRTNPDFRGHPNDNWSCFSTLFFAQRENTRSTLGRLLVIIWLFVVLIINSSYTASLTSILTVQCLYPAINSIDSLRTSDAPIGYQTGSFVRGYLQHELHIDPSRLIPLDSMQKYVKALNLGPSRGGVAAVIDELP